MSRVFLRRERILPGPLKILQQPRRRRPMPVTALALASAVLATGFLVIPKAAPRLSVDPTPMAEVADAASSDPDIRTAAEPAQAAAALAEPAVALAESAVIAAPDGPTPQPVGTPSAAAARPAGPSPFQLDLLPVLRADGASLDTGTVPPAAAQRTARVTPRKGTASPRDAVTGGQAQP